MERERERPSVPCDGRGGKGLYCSSGGDVEAKREKGKEGNMESEIRMGSRQDTEKESERGKKTKRQRKQKLNERKVHKSINR